MIREFGAWSPAVGRNAERPLHVLHSKLGPDVDTWSSMPDISECSQCPSTCTCTYNTGPSLEFTGMSLNQCSREAQRNEGLQCELLHVGILAARLLVSFERTQAKSRRLYRFFFASWVHAGFHEAGILTHFVPDQLADLIWKNQTETHKSQSSKLQKPRRSSLCAKHVQPVTAVNVSLKKRASG